MAKSLSNKKDLDESRKAGESSKYDFIKLDDKTSFIVIMNADYVDGYTHYIKNEKGKVSPITCKAGLDGNGFAPDDCEICSDVLSGYNKAKELEKSGDKAEAELLRKETHRMRAQYSMKLAAIKGEVIVERDKKGNKIKKPDFDNVKSIGILSLSDHQKKLLLALIDDENVPSIESGDDLVGKILKIEREEDGNKKVSSITVVGELDIDKMDLGDMPKMDNLFNIPEDYKAEYEAAKSLDTEEKEDTSDNDEKEEYETRLPKEKVKNIPSKKGKKK